MDTWQIVVASAAGFVTLFTLFEKLGVTNKLKKVDTDFNEMRKMLANLHEINKSQQDLLCLQRDQNNALLALLRNDLYQSFKIHRDLGVWTDDEANVQTKLHAAYRALNGNGEEELWWEKKKTWRIVSNEEYRELVSKCSDL
jgi:hypothetical protein